MKERRTLFRPNVFIRSRRQVTTVKITDADTASIGSIRTIYRYPWKRRLLGINTARNERLLLRLRLQKRDKATSTVGLFCRSSQSLMTYYAVRQFIYFLNTRNPHPKVSIKTVNVCHYDGSYYHYPYHYYIRRVVQLFDKYLSMIIAAPGLIFPSLRTVSLGNTQPPTAVFATVELLLVYMRVMSLFTLWVAQIYIEIHMIIITRLLLISMDFLLSKPRYMPPFPPPPPLQEYRKKHRYKHRYNKYGYRYIYGYVYGYGSGRGYSILG